MSKTKVVTGKARMSYVQVFEARAMDENQTKKFSVALLIPKSDTKTVKKIQAAIQAARLEGKEKYGAKFPMKSPSPLRDGDVDKEGDDVYAGCYFVNAKSVRKPKVVDAGLNEILDPEEFYSGCYGRASINFYPFDVPTNKGIACGLQNLQFLEDGERLGGGGSSVESDFGDDDNDLDDLG
jgi:hypothetical protein